jgi:hypothetical protein
MNTDELRVAAKKRLKAQHDFKQFLAVWGAVSVLLIVIWLLTGAWGYFWPIWPIFVMGIALVFVGLDAYGPSKHITEDAIDAEVARLVAQQQQRAAAREAASQPNPTQASYAGQHGYEQQHPYQAAQTGQAPVYDPAQYGQTAAYDTSQYATGPTGGYGSQQGSHATQQYGAYQAPSAEAGAPEAPASATASEWTRAAEPTPTEQFAAVFSGTDRAPEASTATDPSAEPAESIVFESTSAGDAETVAAAADETEARLATDDSDAVAATTTTGTTGRDETASAAAPAPAVSAPRTSSRSTTTRSTTARKPATKTGTTATAAGTTVRKTSSTRATTGSTTPKAAAAKSTTTKAASTKTPKTTDAAAKPTTAKAPAKPRTTKPKAAPAAAPAPSEQPGTPE